MRLTSAEDIKTFSQASDICQAMYTNAYCLSCDKVTCSTNHDSAKIKKPVGHDIGYVDEEMTT